MNYPVNDPRHQHPSAGVEYHRRNSKLASMAIRVEAAIGQLYVAASIDSPYPDAAHDLTGRVKDLLATAVEQAVMADWDPTLPSAPIEEEEEALIGEDEDDY